MLRALAREKLSGVSPALTSLIALQALDSASDALRKRLAELPKAEQAIEAAIDAAQATVGAVKTRNQENHDARRALEKDVAAVDTRLARFDDHRAAVKTNQEYTALLHEIATAKAEKDAIEERLLLLMEEADGLSADLKAATATLSAEQADAEKARAALNAERTTIDAELARLASERPAASAGVDGRVLALYEQLLKGRRGLAVTGITNDICEGCHVRLRPHVTQQVRRNDSIVQCDNCQRILYFVAPGSGTGFVSQSPA